MRRETLYTVQGLRCIAALSVVFSHAADLVVPADSWIWSVPWTGGVDLFFVISGFIMLYLTHDAFGRPGAARHFLVRRLIRIVPAYWFFTTLTVCAVTLAGGRLKSTTIHADQLLASYAFVPWPREDGAMVPIVGQGWTLNYEMLFYLLFALALPWRRGTLLLGMALVALAASHRLYLVDWRILRFWSEPIILEFLGGMALARLYLADVRLPFSAALASIGLAITVYTHADTLGLDALGRAGRLGVPALLFCAAMVLIPQPKRIGRWWRGVATGGDASYALYLAHYLIINAVILGWKRLAWDLPWLGVTIAVTLSCATAWLFHILLERPLTRRLQARL